MDYRFRFASFPHLWIDYFEQSGLGFSDQFESKIDSFLKENEIARKKLKEKGGNKTNLHDYDLSDFGLTADEVKESFAHYIKSYDL
jgi:hypothetical protein